MNDVLRQLERKISPDRAGCGIERIGLAHHLADGRHRARALERQRDDRTGGDEVDQLAEERALAVLGVVRLCGGAVELHEAHAAKAEAAALEAADDFGHQRAAYRIGPEQNERGLHRIPRSAAASSRPCRNHAVEMGVDAQYGQTRQCGSNGLPQPSHARRSCVEHSGHTR